MSSRNANFSRKLRYVDPAAFTPQFAWRRAKDSASGAAVFCESLPLARIAEQAGTPAYVYSRSAIEATFRELDRSLARLPHTICYAVKANGNLSILRLLAGLGSGFDIVSGGELESFSPAWARRARRSEKRSNILLGTETQVAASCSSTLNRKPNS